MMCILLLLLADIGSASNTLYKYNISGTIYSTSENEADKVMPDMRVRLFEKDDGFLNADDNLGQSFTNGQGHFEGLVGEEDEGAEPQPYLRIPIDGCSNFFLVCKRFWQLYDLESIDRY
jgi:hypothetical protein